MYGRPSSSAGQRPPSAAGGTQGLRGGQRPDLTSSMGRNGLAGTAKPLGTARPGSRGGAPIGGALNSMVQVADRPVTRQGLSGIKTAAQGPQRQVQDKSYWLGILRSKISELSNEIGKLNKEINQFNQDNANYVGYEKRAESLAAEIKELQGELADYNALVDKLNTNSSFEDLKEDYEMLKSQNEKETKVIDDLFAQRQDKEQQLKSVEREIDQERRMTESLVSDMNPTLREKYSHLKNSGLSLQEELEHKQQELDNLNDKIERLEEEISQSPVKQEAVTLYEKIHDLEEKRNSLLDELNKDKKSTPEEEREKLLKQVKDDNQETARIENRISELSDKREKIIEEIRQMEMDLEEHQGERAAKYKELKKREETMQEFLDTYDETQKSETLIERRQGRRLAQELMDLYNQVSSEQKGRLEATIVAQLEAISRAMIQTKHMPNAADFDQVKEDLTFKETEMLRSQETAKGLGAEHSRLQLDLEKVQQLETKITGELDSLKDKIATMTKELETYDDVEGLKMKAEDKKRLLAEERSTLQTKRAQFKEDVQRLSAQYETAKSQLQENETYIQLGNLERKLQHLEQNNFAIKEFIAQRNAEGNYQPTKASVFDDIERINQTIIKGLSTLKL